MQAFSLGYTRNGYRITAFVQVDNFDIICSWRNKKKKNVVGYVNLCGLASGSLMDILVTT